MLCRDGVYYFVRRIPADMQEHYDKCRLYFSLRTQSKIRTVRAAQSITQPLDDYWMGVRLQKLDTFLANSGIEKNNIFECGFWLIRISHHPVILLFYRRG